MTDTYHRNSAILAGFLQRTIQGCIRSGARTAMAEYVGTPGYGLFKDTSANDLGAHAIRAALELSNVSASRVQHAVMGNAMQTSADAISAARHAALNAGIPIETPALTITRLSNSGIQHHIPAAHSILTIAREGFRLGAASLRSGLSLARAAVSAASPLPVRRYLCSRLCGASGRGSHRGTVARHFVFKNAREMSSFANGLAFGRPARPPVGSLRPRRLSASRSGWTG